MSKPGQPARPRRRSASRAPRAPRLLAALFTFAALASLAGCTRDEAAAGTPLTQAVERGPFKLALKITPAEVWIGDSLTLELTVHTPAEALVRFVAPELSPPLTAPPTDSRPADRRAPDFGLRAQQADPPKPVADAGLLWRQTYSLEPLASGTLEVPALRVEYARGPAPGEAAYDAELVTEPVKIAIRSALTTQDSVERPRDISGALLLPARPWTALEWSLLLGAVVGATAGLYAAIAAIRRHRNRPKPPVAPEIWALQALEALAPAQWFAQQRERELYYRLSEILRAYIERKFGLHAPEMTTEEFLGALARDQSALPCDAYRLRAFLEACDLVKYAALRPLLVDGEQAHATARAFIHTTAAAVETQRAAALVSGGRAA